MSKYIIYLEGNIGSGKSTLLPRIANALKRILSNTNIYEYLEPIDKWNEIKHCDVPLLKLLYDKPQYADRFQYLTLITRQSQLLEFLEKPGEGIALIERSYLSVGLFQKVLHGEGYKSIRHGYIQNRTPTDYKTYSYIREK